MEGNEQERFMCGGFVCIGDDWKIEKKTILEKTTSLFDLFLQEKSGGVATMMNDE